MVSPKLSLPQLHARLGGLRTRATHDPTGPGGYSEAGRAAFLARFEHEVDPDGSLPPEERAARADAARRAYMTSLAVKAAAARLRRDREELQDVARVAALERRLAALEGRVEAGAVAPTGGPTDAAR